MISSVVGFTVAVGLLSSCCAYGATVTSIRDGLWTDPSTWSSGSVPGLSDQTIVTHAVVLSAGQRAEVSDLSIAGYLSLASGATLQLSSTDPTRRVLHVTGVLECAEGSIVNGGSDTNSVFAAGSRYVHMQGPLGFIPIATWDKESTLQISGFIDDGYINIAHANSWRQSFGNVEYDCPQQRVFVVDLNGNLRNIRGNFSIRNTNNKTLRLCTTQQVTLNVGGDLIVEGRSQVWFTTNSPNCTVNVGGNFVYRSEASSASYLSTRGNIRLVIEQDFNIDSPAVLRMASSVADSIGSRQSWVSIGGDFNFARGSLVAPPAGSGTGTIEFRGVTIQRVIIQPVATALVGNVAYAVASGAHVSLGTSILSSERGSLVVHGALELGSLDAGGAIQRGHAGGNIRIPGARTFSENSRIIYNGDARQAIGEGHPETPNTVVDNPAGIVQLDDLVIRGDLAIVRGSIDQSTNWLTVEGNVVLGQADMMIQRLRLSGSRVQAINANGGVISRLDIEKQAGSVQLHSALLLTEQLQVHSPGITVESNGFLTLASTGDTAGETAAIGALAAGSSIRGDVIVQRFLSAEGRLYRYISSPVAGSTVASLMDDIEVTGPFVDPSTGAGLESANPSLFYYDESLGKLPHGWQAYPVGGYAVDAFLQPGRGYAAFVRNVNSTVLDFIGVLNQGELRIPLSYTIHNGDANGWHLVGNPYASAIDWDASALEKEFLSHVIAVRDNGERRFRYWDGDSQYYDIPGGKIAQGQSFWVRTIAKGASLTFREAAKSSDASFYRRPVTLTPAMVIAVKSGNHWDRAILKLRAQSSDSLDAWDGPKLLDDTLNLATMSREGISMAIDCRPSIPDSINLQLTHLPPGQYSLSLSAQDSLRHLTYFIRDSYVKQIIKLAPSESLPFDVTGDDASANKNRFTIYLAGPLTSRPPDHAEAPSDTSGRTFVSRLHDIMIRDSDACDTCASANFSVRAYPNPVTDELTIEACCLPYNLGVNNDRLQRSDEGASDSPSGQSPLEIDLYNAVGMRIGPGASRIRLAVIRSLPSSRVINQCPRLTIAVEQLAPGAYVARIRCRNRQRWIRFVKV